MFYRLVIKSDENNKEVVQVPETERLKVERLLAVQVLQMCHADLVSTQDVIDASYVVGKYTTVASYDVRIRYIDATCFITSWHCFSRKVRVDDRLSGKSYDLCQCDSGEIFNQPGLEHLANAWRNRIRVVDHSLPQV